MGKYSANKPTIYLETSVLMELIEGPDAAPIVQTMKSVIRDAKGGRFDLVTSVLSIAEVFYAKHEADGRSVDPDIEQKIRLLWHPGTSPIRVVEVSEMIALDSLNLLRNGINQGWSNTKGADGIHLSTATREEADEFFTTEGAMKKWEQVCGFRVCEPHYEALPPPPPPAVPPGHEDRLFPENPK